MVDDLDLLTPSIDHTANYVHQLRTTLNAYLPAYIYIGEALQNALDAARDAGAGPHTILLELDLDDHRVTVTDDGPGFPNQPQLLYLGGGNKQGKRYGGLVGVGLKVVLFSSSNYELRARAADGSTLYCVVDAANEFDSDPRPVLTLGTVDGTFSKDDVPLDARGTRLSYSFPSFPKGIQEQFLRALGDEGLDKGLDHSFGETLTNAVRAGRYPNRFAALLGTYLKRFTYLGLTGVPEELTKTDIEVRIKATAGVLGPLAELADGQTRYTFSLQPGYLTIDETAEYAPANKRRPVLSDKPLLNGGRGLTRTDLGFNRTAYTSKDEYELLLTDARGRVTSERLNDYRERLFPRIRSVRVTIGRIPEFERYLPGGAKHVLSANGVITTHAVEFNRGQNQQYVRCFDVTVDLDAELNYGKTQLTDMYLVGLVRRYLNDAYQYTIQHAAHDYVGKLKSIDEDTSDEFLERPNLGVPLTQRKVPRSENDVIALTFELAGRGHFPDYQWFGLSSKDTYDCRAIIRKPSDPEDYLSEPTVGKLRIVEFKLRAASIARDFMREEKDPRKIDLLIAYEAGTVADVDQFQLLPLSSSPTYGDALNKAFPGVTQVMYDARSGAEVQIVLVKDLLDAVFPAPPPAAALQKDVEEDD